MHDILGPDTPDNVKLAQKRLAEEAVTKLREKMQNARCIDLELLNTPENLALVLEYEKDLALLWGSDVTARVTEFSRNGKYIQTSTPIFLWALSKELGIPFKY